MNKIGMAALSAVFATSTAFAAPTERPAGHWEWRPAPQFGPRAVPGQRRVWVPDVSQATACACPMMERTPDACMSMKGGQPG